MFTSLWPSSRLPGHGTFVRERIECLRQRLDFDYRVIHPLPFYPSLPGGSAMARQSRLPRHERVDGIDVDYPRYFHLPRTGVARQAARVARGARAAFRRVVAEFRPSLIDAHYLWPDGCAALRLAGEAGLPCVVTARGSDVNVLAEDAGVRQSYVELLPRAARVLAVSRPLADRLDELGVSHEPVAVIPNGVDLVRYAPGSQRRDRILTVTRLVPGKRIDLLVRALAVDGGCLLPKLVVCGGGPARGAVERLARTLGVADRLDLRGEMSRDAVAKELADGGVFAFPSAHEGWPNAVLEALASGLPVVASAVGGVPDMLGASGAGVMLPVEADAQAWASALAAAVAAWRSDPASCCERSRARAEELSWERCTEDLAAIWREAGS